MSYEKKLSLIKKSRWISIILGAIMLSGTFYSFGIVMAVLLAVSFSTAFWFIINKYYAQTILDFVKDRVNSIISNINDTDSIVEVNSINSFMIARVYLINKTIQSSLIKEAIIKKIGEKINSKHLRAVQIALIKSKSEYRNTKEEFNKQLVKELIKKSEDTK
ncbi:MAG TPA: hypothetical protein VJ916_09060 [Anaerovoracaceae bacterium]|nr:hypothetical protein [Anaerovoracaceae bacterium]